jgi:hypothetical protein
MFAKKLPGGHTVLVPLDPVKHQRSLQRQREHPEHKEREHHGYAVHDGHTVYIPKSSRGQFRELRENQRERGAKYKHAHDARRQTRQHTKKHDEQNKKRKVKHPILTTLAEASKLVFAEKKAVHPFPPDAWLASTFHTFFGELAALADNFVGGVDPFDAKTPGTTWPVELDVSVIPVTGATDADKYTDFGKAKSKIVSELVKVIGSAQHHHTVWAAELRQAAPLAEKNGVPAPGISPHPLDAVIAEIFAKGGEMKLPKNPELQDHILAKYIAIKVLPTHVEGETGPGLRYAELCAKLEGAVDADTIDRLLKKPERLAKILKQARAYKKSAEKARAKASAPRPGHSEAFLPSEAKASVAPAAAPSLVSMLYHR